MSTLSLFASPNTPLCLDTKFVMSQCGPVVYVTVRKSPWTSFIVINVGRFVDVDIAITILSCARLPSTITELHRFINHLIDLHTYTLLRRKTGHWQTWVETLLVYTVSGKKCQHTFVPNFAKCRPIFEFLSYQLSLNYTSELVENWLLKLHSSANLSLHYLVIYCHILSMRHWFSNINISQGSVATRLRRGIGCYCHFAMDFLPSHTVMKQF